MSIEAIKLPNGRKIGPGHPCFVTAEIGQNHNGDVYLCTRLMKAAHDAGVDAVKLCKRHIPSDMTKAFGETPYIGPNSFGDTYREHRGALELSVDQYCHLKERARYNEWSPLFYCSVCDPISAEEVEAKLDPPMYKIASRDLDNLPLLDLVASFGKPMVLSTGFADEDWEIDNALTAIYKYHANVMLLYCVSAYPTKAEELDLRELIRMHLTFRVPVGISDHTPGVISSLAAVALGACMVEKHITLARAMRGTDHAASLEPRGLEYLVEKIREIEIMLTDAVPPNDVGVRRKLGRSIVTRRNVNSGSLIEEVDLCLKSPGTGLRWRDRDKLIGRTASRFLPADKTLDMADVV